MYKNRKQYEEVGARQQQRKKSTIITYLKDHYENLPDSCLELRTTGSHEAINLQTKPPQTEKQPSTATNENKENIPR